MNRPTAGFTLIELIAVIIILGVLSVSAVGVFSSKSEYEAAAVKNQLLSSLRVAQQLALSRENLSTAVPVTLAISQDSDRWLFKIWDSNPGVANAKPFHVSEIERDLSTLGFSNTDFASNCQALATSNSFSIQFDGDGNLLSNQKLRICIVAEMQHQLCVSALGFSYDGNTCL